MPELPEVEVIMRDTRKFILGAMIERVEIDWLKLIGNCPDQIFIRTLTGATIRDVYRRGKYILIELSNTQIWGIHLRMTGKLICGRYCLPERFKPWIRARFGLSGMKELFYVDPRKFGRFFLTDNVELLLGDLGPEPLSPQFNAEYLYVGTRNRKKCIKVLLLDQKFVAGLGNIYVNEALWLARINPASIARSLTRNQYDQLATAIITILKAAILNNGTSLDDQQYVCGNGQPGYHQVHLNVYGLEGSPCSSCGTPIQRCVVAQRSAFFCPVCQKN